MEPVAIIGIGVIANCGTGVEPFWSGLLEGRTNDFRADFDPSPFYETTRLLRRTDRFEQFAVAAAEEALAQVDLTKVSEDRCGVVISSAVGGGPTFERQIQNFYTRGPAAVSGMTISMGMPNAAAAAVAMRYGFHGPAFTMGSACATGTDSVINGCRLLAGDEADLVVAGGSESVLVDAYRQFFMNTGAGSLTRESRPFDKDRNGFVLSEGAGIVVLERLSDARRRGSDILAVISGWGCTSDAFHVSAPDPSGQQASRCMRLALERAGLPAGDITYINAHGTGTVLNDQAEITAIRSVFQGRIPPITAMKGTTGHALAAAGSIEIVGTVKSMRAGVIPPTAGTVVLDPAFQDVDLVTSPRGWQPGPVLSNSFGFGGHNACVVLTPAQAP